MASAPCIFSDRSSGVLSSLLKASTVGKPGARRKGKDAEGLRLMRVGLQRGGKGADGAA